MVEDFQINHPEQVTESFCTTVSSSTKWEKQ